MITENQAIKIAQSQLKEGFTISFLSINQAEDFIWSYLYDNGFQYNTPIEYINDFGYKSVAIVHQDN
jgi:hypothetical protein